MRNHVGILIRDLPLLSKQQLEKLYIDQALSTRECAAVLGLPTHGSVTWWLKKFGITARSSRFQPGNKINKGRNPQECSGWKGGKVEWHCVDCGRKEMVFPCKIETKKRCNDCKEKMIDLTGQEFGLLTVLHRSENSKHGKTRWLCKCVCGMEKIVLQGSLKNAKTASCGCKTYRTGSDHPAFSKIQVTCPICGEIRLTHPSRVSLYKNVTCGKKDCISKLFSDLHSGHKNTRWIGGKKVVGFDSYFKRFDRIEEIRRDPNNESILQVKCTYCDRWFSPSRSAVSSRIRSTEGQKGATGENRFYCSDDCKSSCSIYKKIRWPLGYRKATSREVDPLVRKMTFERDNWQCQICGSDGPLHCHHIEGYTQKPVLANDIDNLITLCKKHHKWVHSKEGCRYFELRCEPLFDGLLATRA